MQWTENDLLARNKSHPAKLALAARLRQDTTLSVKQIAERMHLRKPKGGQDQYPQIHEPLPNRRSTNPTGNLLNHESRGSFLRCAPGLSPPMNKSIT
jgi:hypothetical protein